MCEMNLESPVLHESAQLASLKGVLEYRDAKAEYVTLAKQGTRYGPSFRTVDKTWVSPDLTYTVLESQLRELNLPLPSPDGSPASVDAPTLDTHLQGGLLGTGRKMGAWMPNYISRLRISNDMPASPSQRFTVVNRRLGHDTKAGSSQFSSAVFANSCDSLVPVAEWESVTIRSIGSSDVPDPRASLPSSYCWDFIPSIDHADNIDLAKTLKFEQPEENELSRQRMFDRAGIYFMTRTLEEVAESHLPPLPSHLTKFFNWAKRVVSRENVTFSDDESAFLHEVSQINSPCELICNMGMRIMSIIRGEVEPLDVMLKDNLLMRYYQDDRINARMSRMLAKNIRFLADVRPGLRVLEIGAGTASATLPVLQALSQGAGKPPMFSSYTFTDISPGFFEPAAAKLLEWAGLITFKTLDIGQDPEKQGFSREAYDVVIASNVLHATPDMAVTIRHVRSLLRPNGKLFLLEGIRHGPSRLPFALLPGWWLSEDEFRDKQEGPLMPEDSWQHLLSAQGFSGTDTVIQDHPGNPERLISVICSTNIGIHKVTRGSKITICGHLINPEEQQFAKLVSACVSGRLNLPTDIKTLEKVNQQDDPFCVFVDTERHSILTGLTAATFDAVRRTLRDVSGLLWVIPENSHPDAEMIRGILRTLRLEDGSKKLILLENIPCTKVGASAITRVAGRLQYCELAKTVDQDLVWRDGMIHVSRFKEVSEAKEVFAADAGAPVRKIQRLWQDDKAFQLTVDAAGSLDSIYFCRSDALQEEVGEGEILIKTEAAGVNFFDLLTILGSIPWSPPGAEGVGTVVKAGPGVTDVQIGDRVLFLAQGHGAFSNYMRMPSWSAYKIPPALRSADTASIPVAYATAVMALMHSAHLKKGETVLIHSASGATGQACVVLAQHLECQVFAKAGSPEKMEFLHSTFGIPLSQIFSSRNAEFRNGILRATGGKGVDVVVNSLSGDLLQESWSLVSDFGRFVEIGKKDILQNKYLGMRPFKNNVTFFALDLRSYFEKRPEGLKECLAEVVDLMERNVVVPIRPVTTLPLCEIGAGLRKLQSGRNIGKIVVTMGPEECVLAECPSPLAGPSGGLLRPDATYIITGGTGGIGISLGSWMVENGARNVVLLGRSGSSRPKVQSLLDRYANTDALVTLASRMSLCTL